MKNVEHSFVSKRCDSRFFEPGAFDISHFTALNSSALHTTAQYLTPRTAPVFPLCGLLRGSSLFFHTSEHRHIHYAYACFRDRGQAPEYNCRKEIGKNEENGKGIDLFIIGSRVYLSNSFDQSLYACAMQELIPSKLLRFQPKW